MVQSRLTPRQSALRSLDEARVDTGSFLSRVETSVVPRWLDPAVEDIAVTATNTLKIIGPYRQGF
jgi:hypothetical protein